MLVRLPKQTRLQCRPATFSYRPVRAQFAHLQNARVPSRRLCTANTTAPEPQMPKRVVLPPLNTTPPPTAKPKRKYKPVSKLLSPKWKPIAPYNARLQEAVEKKDEVAVANIFEEIYYNELMINLDTIHLLMKHAINTLNEELLVQARGLMTAYDLRANETTYNLSIEFYKLTNNDLALEDAQHKLKDYLFAKQHLPHLVSQ